MTEENSTFLGYDVKELLKVCLRLKCPRCKQDMFQIFVSPNSENLIFLCYQCRYIPTLEEILEGRTEGVGGVKNKR